MSEQIGIKTGQGYHKTSALEAGDVIVSQKKLLWSSDTPININSKETVKILEFDHSVTGKTIELVTSNGVYRFYVLDGQRDYSFVTSGVTVYGTDGNPSGVAVNCVTITFSSNNGAMFGSAQCITANVKDNTVDVSTSDLGVNDIRVYKVYEITE